jgi:MFS family permease
VIWLSYLVGQAGFWVSNVSLQWLVLRLSKGDSFHQGLLFFFNFIPILLVSPLGGLMADRFDRKRLAVFCQLGISVVAGLLSVVSALGLDRLATVYAFAFALGLLLAIAGPVGQALVANSVAKADLSSAVSLQSVGVNLSRVAGPALAIPILLTAGPAPAFAGYSVAALITSGLLSRVRITFSSRQAPASGWWRELRGGFDHASERHPALVVLSLVAVSSMTLSSYVALLPIFAYTVLGRGASGFGGLVIATGVGACVGAFATGMIEGRIRVAYSAGLMIAMAAALVVLAVSRNYNAALGAAAFAGGFNFALMTTLSSSLQHLVDDSRRGRVMSLYLISWGGLVPIGGLIIGLVATLVSPTAAVISFACVGAAYGAAIAYRHRGERVLSGGAVSTAEGRIT